MSQKNVICIDNENNINEESFVTSTQNSLAESKTVFSISQNHFPGLDEKLNILKFLDACSDVVTIIEKFGKVFSPIVNDMNGNIKKLRQKYEEDPTKYEDLEEMIIKEKHSETGRIVAADALIWLQRALNFISVFFNNILNDSIRSEDLSEIIRKTYVDTLQSHHGWLGSQLFNVLSRFAPHRSALFYKLALNNYDKEDQILQDMRLWQEKIALCVARISDFYSANDILQ